MLTDGQWAVLELLIEACRPKGKTPPQDLRRTIEAILKRHQKPHGLDQFVHLHRAFPSSAICSASISAILSSAIRSSWGSG